MTTESLASLEPQVLRSEPPAARPRPRPEPTSDTLRRGASLAATARLSSTERLPSALAALLANPIVSARDDRQAVRR